MVESGEKAEVYQLFLHLWGELRPPGSYWSVDAFFITRACDAGLIRPQETVSIKKQSNTCKMMLDDVARPSQASHRGDDHEEVEDLSI